MSRFGVLLLTLCTLNGCGVAAASRAEPALAATFVSGSRLTEELGPEQGEFRVLSDEQPIPERRAARPLHTPAPEYPESERASGAEARVVVHYYVDERGLVSAISTEGPPAFRQKVLEAMATWRFAPALVDGVPRRSPRKARFQFRLAS
jgi:TonB family protein